MSVEARTQADVPDFLRFLDQTLMYRLRRRRTHELGYPIYFVDFSSWKLRFSDQTPVIHVRAADTSTLSPREIAQSIADVVRIQNLAESNSLVLVDKPIEGLQEYFKLVYLPVIVLDAEDQQVIMNSRRPTGELLDRICAQLSLASLSPYDTSKPVTGSRFFGREQEIHRILSGVDSNVAIMGVRRVGKTSLLRELERRLQLQALEHGDAHATERILYMDCSAIRTPEHFLEQIVRQLNPRELNRLEHRRFRSYLPEFLQRTSKLYGGQLVFLLDEIDALLLSTFTDSEVLNELRSTSNAGFCRFIVAGFRRLLESTSSLDSPFFNFARPLRLKEFSRDDTARLIVQPMENLRINFERQSEVVDRIYAETAGQPNLIQFYCNVLIEHLDRENRRYLSPENLVQIYRNEDFRTYILSTFMDNTSNLEKAIVFAVTLDLPPQQAFDQEAIDQVLAARGIQPLLSDLEKGCRNLELAGTLTRKGRHYQFATPIFPEILQTIYNVEFLFKKILQEGIW